MRRAVLAALMSGSLLLAGCAGDAPVITPAPTITAAAASPVAPDAAATPAATPTDMLSATAEPPPPGARPSVTDTSGIVWLCRPGLTEDPCTSDLATTLVEPDGTTRREAASPAQDPPVDCFYVYPTVSTQPGTNADLRIQPEERAVAVAQASRFSQVCRVYAPMYPQLTLAAIGKPGGITVQGALTAYQGVEAAFRDYLANDNDGRGIVFIGHSQGASMLIALLKQVVDPDPDLRRLLVSALVMGGNAAVPIGGTVGGDFKNIPECTSTAQTGCVVAYSSFDQQPPPDALFGRVGTGLSPFRDPAAAASLQIACVNPASVSGGTGSLQPYFPSKSLLDLTFKGGLGLTVDTPWIAFPNEYSAHCETSSGATWLQVDDARGPSDHRPVVRPRLAPTWGLHVVDVNIALGNLVDLVRAEESSFTP